MASDEFMFALLFMFDDDDDFDIIRLLRSRRKTAKRIHSCWVKPWVRSRTSKECNTMYKLQEEIRLQDKEEYRAMMRMDTDTFYYLLEKVGPLIQKMDTNYRDALPAAEVLSAVLKFLAFGGVQRDIARQFRNGRSTMCHKIPLVCEAIYSALADEYMKTPKTRKGWLDVAAGFNARWNFPHCIGAIDGKHVRIIVPNNSGSVYYNYKGTFSVVLLAVVDHNYEFIYVDVGTEGRSSDGGIWGRCSMKQYLDDDDLNVPKPRNLPGTDVQTPFVLLGDNAFPLDIHMMKPYGRRDLSTRQAIFNYRLSRARRVSENAFGILANRFRVFLTTIYINPDTVISLALAATALHNMLRRRCGKNYIPLGSIDTEDMNHDIIPGDWRKSNNQLPKIFPCQIKNPPRFCTRIRDTLADYFLSEAGSVPWQRRAIRI